MALKPWYNVITPREDLVEGKPMDASEFPFWRGHAELNMRKAYRDFCLSSSP